MRSVLDLIVLMIVIVCTNATTLFAATPTGTREDLTSGWMIQSSCKVNAPGSVVSTRDFKPEGWHATRVPSTVLAALVAAKVYPDPYYGMNLRSIPGADYPIGKVFSRLPMPENSPFRCSWWYRTEFNAPASGASGRKVWLNFGGINYRANIWVNGKQVAKADDVAGAYRMYELDITDAIMRDKPNVLAVEVFAPSETDLAVNWVDWNPAPPDKDMGLWREVYLTTSGPVSVRYPQVMSKVDTTSLRSVELTVTAELNNSTDHPIKGVLNGTIEKVRFSQPVELAAHETKLVTFSPEAFPQLKFANPRLWWPWQMGAPNLYTLDIEVESAGQMSDRQTTTFGIREVTSELTDKGYRLFKINGKNILIRGGGWAPDMMLRSDPKREEQEVRYTRDMGLNTIRLEGKLESDSFYDLADRYGILIMPGWCCCDIWEKWAEWKPGMPQVATESLKSQVLRMRNHPSIYVWLNGSDFPPAPEVEQAYLDVLKKYNWPNPVVSSATARPTSFTGASGVKMSGPYDYVPPEYWYADKKLGGAYGYNTETSPGPAVPPVESLRKFIPKDHLWPIDDVWNYHAGGGSFTQMNLFTKGMNERYGEAHSLEDFATKSQALAYDGERAMFEAYSVNKYTSTGVIQWMLNNEIGRASCRERV
jgi:exo-1,4-beta-D-glucosaminidase